ncbi:MAG: hypothetical protein ACTSR2_09400 [Candidatus Hodarchaeales archaeon]
MDTIKIKAEVLRKMLLLLLLRTLDNTPVNVEKLQMLLFFFSKESLDNGSVTQPIFNCIKCHSIPCMIEVRKGIEEFEKVGILKSGILSEIGKQAADVAYHFFEVVIPETLLSLIDIVDKYGQLTFNELQDIFKKTDEYLKTEEGRCIYCVKDWAVFGTMKTWEDLEKFDEELADQVEDLILSFDKDFVDVVSAALRELEASLVEDFDDAVNEGE